MWTEQRLKKYREKAEISRFKPFEHEIRWHGYKMATKQALYNLEHPVVYTPKSVEVQQACIKEREFYITFLEKLENL